MAGVEERTGEAFEFAERLTVVGRKLQAGEQAPDFTLEHFDPAESAMKQVRLADTTGSVRLLNVVNSLDTPVCHVETRRWEGLRGDLPAGTTVYTISMDLPFAQARWQTAEGVAHQSLSAHQSEDFGRDYGVLLKEWRLLQRAVFVIDRDGRIVHAEYVPDQMAEPDYDAAVAAARQAADS
jgi:thiol peroxidase